MNLYPRLDQNGLGDYYFSFGIKKEFAKKCFEKEITEEGYNNFQDLGRKMFTKVFGNDEHNPLFDYDYPYRFFGNSKGNNTCLIRNLTVPGNACGLDVNINDDMEKALDRVNEYENFIKYHSHNIDSTSQCYAFLSLLTTWEETIDCVLNAPKK